MVVFHLPLSTARVNSVALSNDFASLLAIWGDPGLGECANRFSWVTPGLASAPTGALISYSQYLETDMEVCETYRGGGHTEQYTERGSSTSQCSWSVLLESSA